MRGALLAAALAATRTWPQVATGDFPPEIYAQPEGDAAVGVWPWPKSVAVEPGRIELAADFALSDQSGFGVVQRACERYAPLVAKGTGALKALTVTVEKDVDANRGVDESYVLKVGPDAATLEAKTSVGALRGLETFSQLVGKQGSINASKVEIEDAPRFPHRGLLVDSSRHFFPLAVLQKMVDAMAWNKLNVLHWHLTDAQAAPLATPVAKELGIDKGADSPKDVYSIDDFKSLVAYARDRGVRVVPELDMPAHTQAWGKGDIPEINCGYQSVMDVKDKRLVPKVEKLLGEFASVFPDQLFHLGFDEVNRDCLSRGPSIASFVQAEGGALDDELTKNLLGDFFETVGAFVTEKAKAPVVWQEAFDFGALVSQNVTDALRKRTLVQAWKGANWEGSPSRPRELIEAGFTVLDSPPAWYFDNGAEDDWPHPYLTDPARDYECSWNNDHNAVGCNCLTAGVTNYRTGKRLACTSATDASIEGGEAALWAEHITPANLMTKAWPRGSAIAERLWSQPEVTDVRGAWPRLSAQACRMQDRGVAGTPLGAGSCESADSVAVADAPEPQVKFTDSSYGSPFDAYSFAQVKQKACVSRTDVQQTVASLRSRIDSVRATRAALAKHPDDIDVFQAKSSADDLAWGINDWDTGKVLDDYAGRDLCADGAVRPATPAPAK